MNITSDNINNLLIERQKLYSQPAYIEQSIIREENMKQKELNLIQVTPICPSNVTDVADRILGVDEHTLGEIIKRDYLDPKMMEAMKCVLGTYFIAPPIGLPSNLRIRHLLKDVRKIGGPSVEGDAMVSNIDNVRDALVIKAPKNKQNDNLLHELIVGLYGTNLLRQHVPNFAYIFGGFKCSPPFIGKSWGIGRGDAKKEEREVRGWCTEYNNIANVNYVVYENVAPSVSFGDYVKTCSGDQYLRVFMQILLALDIANLLIDFTHYDLHDQNVLIRNVGAMHSIKYDDYYLESDKVATIIDYGFSHIKYNGNDYGIAGRESYYVYEDRSYPLYDAFKLFMFTMRSALGAGNRDVIEVGRKILRYFTMIESLESIVTNASKNYYSLPRELVKEEMRQSIVMNGMIEGGEKNIRGLMKWIIENVGVTFMNEKPRYPVLGCGEYCMNSVEEGVNKITMNRMTNLDMYDFYEVAKYYGAQSDITWKILAGNTGSVVNDINKEYSRIIGRYERVIRGRENVSIRQQGIGGLVNNIVLNNYMKYINGLAELYDTYVEIKLFIEIVMYLDQNRMIKVNQNESWDNLLSLERELREYLRSRKEMLKRDLENIEKNKERLIRNRETNWYLIGPFNLFEIMKV
ncbi:Protein kinase [Orpheovirus IHUMI-LCC2]|uniref:Protein kinase n=1 Tax=Orpheovirus IHUMI-LCC2 TaxID=2023057 RepID=A0A2I2L5Y1_9VIRU|nr:Protein kinase [Orpheovirus IHUMI-LCC2]SNW62952.1 Protein kinase [Orpheovirus IHUMI-LCC2]